MLEAMRGYLHAASGLTELTRKRAQELATSLLAATGSASTGAVAAQVSSVADDLISAAKSNRAAVREMVRGEVEVAVGRLGLVPASELDRAHRKIARLEASVAELTRSHASGSGHSAGAAGGSSATAGRARPKRSAVKSAATATKAPAKKTSATATAKKAAKKATANKATARKATARKATARKATAKKATARKTAAKRADTGSGS